MESPYWEGRRSEGIVAILEPEEKETLWKLHRIIALDLRNDSELTDEILGNIKALCDKLENPGRKYWPSEAMAQMAFDILQERKERGDSLDQETLDGQVRALSANTMGCTYADYYFAPMHQALEQGMIDLVEFLVRECGFRADSKMVHISEILLPGTRQHFFKVIITDPIQLANRDHLLKTQAIRRPIMQRLLWLGLRPVDNVIEEHDLMQDGTYNVKKFFCEVYPGITLNPDLGNQWIRLQDTCRRAILNSSGGKSWESKTLVVDKLKLPESLKTFLKFEDKDYFCVSTET